MTSISEMCILLSLVKMISQVVTGAQQRNLLK